MTSSTIEFQTAGFLTAARRVMPGRTGRRRLQQARAQRRRQRQRDEHRQQHRRHDGDRELAVDDAGRAAEERHRDEHRRQHQRDADQCAGDLVHRLARRLHRRQALLGHQPLDVLDDDDRVVHEQAERDDDGDKHHLHVFLQPAHRFLAGQ